MKPKLRLKKIAEAHYLKKYDCWSVYVWIDKKEFWVGHFRRKVDAEKVAEKIKGMYFRKLRQRNG